MKLTIIGLGVKEGDLSIKAFEVIKKSPCVVLRTENTDSAETIRKSGINYITLDGVYEKSKNFDTLTKNICKEISNLLKQSDVCYLVDGAVSDDSCASMLIQKHKDVTVFEGVSKAGEALARTGLGVSGYTSVSAYGLKDFNRFSLPLVIYDLDNVILASEWKLKLFSYIGEEAKVRLYVDKQMFSLPMYEIDTLNNYDYSTVLIVEDVEISQKERFDFTDLIEIVKILRSDNGCPWDKVQTKESICKSLIEECYELVDAVNKKDNDKILEETGDLLLQTAFYINFAEEENAFDRNDVLSGICNKLIFRHTHVFGDDKATNAEEALKVWNKNKQVEKQYETATAYLSDVPKNLPASLRAEKVIKRALSYNVDLGDVKLSAQKMVKILDNLLNQGSDVDYKNLIFICINLLQKSGVSAEEAISLKTEEFISDFKMVEDYLKTKNLNLKNLDPDQVNKYYNEVKKS